MMPEKRQNVKIITKGGLVVVEIDGISYTPIGKFKKNAQEVIQIIEKHVKQFNTELFPEEYRKGVQLMVKSSVENVIIEDEFVVFKFPCGEIKVKRSL